MPVAHTKPQLVPSQLGAAFGSVTVHGEHEAPHELTEEFDTQVVPQR